MNEKLHIETCTTAAESSFRNVTVEQHNLILAKAMERTLEDKCEQEIAVVLPVSIKKAFQNHSGDSQNELVFSFNVKKPSPMLASSQHGFYYLCC